MFRDNAAIIERNSTIHAPPNNKTSFTGARQTSRETMNPSHAIYLNKKHRIRCENIFSEEEFEILVNCGEWFYALVEGKIEPYTDAQTKFIEFHKNMDSKPSNAYQSVWKKYQLRIAFEKKNFSFDGQKITARDLPDSALGINPVSHEPRF